MGFLAPIVGIAAKKIIATLILGGASVFYQKRQQKKLQRQAEQAKRDMEGFRLSFGDPAQARTFAFATDIRSSGPVIYAYVLGPYLVMIIPMSTQQMSWTSTKTMWVDGEQVTLDRDQGNGWWSPSSGKYATPSSASFYVCAKLNYSAWDSQVGSGLIGGVLNLPGLATQWDDTHTCTGFSYMSVYVGYHQNLFQGLPDLSFNLIPSASTSTQTYMGSDLGNPATALYEYMTQFFGESAANIDLTSFLAAKSRCDETVSGKKRYQISQTFQTDQTPQEIIDTILDSMNGDLIKAGATWFLKNNYATPTITFDEDDIVGPINVETRRSYADAFNRVIGLYKSEVQSDQPQTYPPVVDSTAVSQDGETITYTLDLPQVPEPEQAQRIALIELKKNRLEISLSLKVNARGLLVKAGDTINLTIARYGWTSKPFVITSHKIIVADEVSCAMNLQETSSAVYDDYSGSSIGSVAQTNLPRANEVTDPTNLQVTEALYSIGDIVGNRVTVTWDHDYAFLSRYEVEYKLSSGSNWIAGGSADGRRRQLDLDVTQATDFDFRVRAVSTLEYRSNWLTLNNVEILGKTANPSDVAGLSLNIIGSILEATWTKNNELDLSHYKVTVQPYWRPDNSALVASSINSKSNEFTLKLPTSSSFSPADFYIVFSVVAVDTTGNESVTPATAKIGYKVPHAVLNARIQKVKSKIILNWDDVLTQDSEKITGTDIYYQYLNLDTFRVYRTKSGTGVTALHGQVKGSFYTYEETEPGSYTYDITWVDVLGRESTAVTVGPVVITGDEEYQVFETYSATPAEISLASQNYKYRDGYATAFTSAAGQLTADESEILLGVFLVPYYNTDEFGASNKEWSVRNQRVHALTGATPTKWSEFTAAGFDYWLQPATIREAYPVDPRTEKQIYLQTGILYFYPATMQHSAIAVTPVFDLGSTLSSVNLQIEIDWEYYGTFPDLLIEVISGPSTFSAASFGVFPAQSGQSLNRGTFVTLGATRQFYVRLISFNETGKELVSLRGITVQVVMPEIIASGKSNVLAADAGGGGTEITMDKSFVDIRSFSGSVKGKNFTIVPDWDELTDPDKIYLAAYNSSGVAQDCEIIWEVRGI